MIYLKYIAFVPLRAIPRHMWKTPKITDSFILILLANDKLFFVYPQAKSYPKAVVQSGLYL